LWLRYVLSADWRNRNLQIFKPNFFMFIYNIFIKKHWAVHHIAGSLITLNFKFYFHPFRLYQKLHLYCYLTDFLMYITPFHLIIKTYILVFIYRYLCKILKQHVYSGQKIIFKKKHRLLEAVKMIAQTYHTGHVTLHGQILLNFCRYFSIKMDFPCTYCDETILCINFWIF
jgi:hypothetical protein